jgi:hypothetical protein
MGGAQMPPKQHKKLFSGWFESLLPQEWLGAFLQAKILGHTSRQVQGGRFFHKNEEVSFLHSIGPTRSLSFSALALKETNPSDFITYHAGKKKKQHPPIGDIFMCTNL